MATDVRLDAVNGNFVLVEGQGLKVAGSDLILDSAERRKNQGPNRRALVHDSQDGLTINFNNDYPGGVTVSGNVVVTGDLFLAGAALRTTLAELKSTIDSLRFESNQKIDFAFSRIDRLETIADSLVELVGASIIPPWKTKTDVERGNNEVALGGGPAILPAEQLGLTIDFEFDRQRPGFAHEDVVSIEPAPGTVVKRGSTVIVTINLEG